MTTGSDNVFPKVILDAVTSDPAAPANDNWKVFARVDGVYAVSSNTTVGPFGGVGNAVATDTIWDAAGDLVQGTGANTAAKLTVGAAGTTLKSTGSAAAWVACPNIWKMSISSSVTLTNNTDTVITFDRADIDGGGSVIDLANDRFVAPATGFYQVIVDWLWETTAPVAGPFMNVTVGGTDTLLFRVPSPTAATAVFNADGGYNATNGLSLTSGDFVKLTINPRAVTGCTARGNASARLSTSMTLIRLT